MVQVTHIKSGVSCKTDSTLCRYPRPPNVVQPGVAVVHTVDGIWAQVGVATIRAIWSWSNELNYTVTNTVTVIIHQLYYTL